MPSRLLQLVAWTTLAQVALVGGLGTGLHGLLGCEHDRCSAVCCVGPVAGCQEDCAFCRHAAEKQREVDSRVTPRGVVMKAASCDDCALCDLLAQYHTAAPFALDPPPTELAAGEAALHRENAIVAAAIRLALSRGPPVG